MPTASKKCVDGHERDRQAGENCMHTIVKLSQFIITVIDSQVKRTCVKVGKIGTGSRIQTFSKGHVAHAAIRTQPRADRTQPLPRRRQMGYAARDVFSSGELALFRAA
jgi:hypothetical protein